VAKKEIAVKKYVVELSAEERERAEFLPEWGKANGARELVPDFNFVACPVDYPFQDMDVDLYCGSELYLRSYPYVGDEEWNKGKDDSLRIGGKPRWTGLMVEKTTVARFWPFAPAVNGDVVETTKTGAAGRPRVMHIFA
jgi:hypothetical protein